MAEEFHNDDDEIAQDGKDWEMRGAMMGNEEAMKMWTKLNELPNNRTYAAAEKL